MPLDQLASTLANIGLTPAVLTQLIASIALVVVACLLSYFMGRMAGPALAQWWANKAGERASGIGRRICKLVRYTVSTLLLMVVLHAGSWDLPASVVLGFSAGLSLALLAWTFTRGLHFPSWVAGVLALALFAAVLSDAVNGLRSLASILGGVGLKAAGRSITLLDVAQVGIALMVLAAAVRLTRRIVAHSIAKTDRLDSAQKVLAQKLVGVALIAAAFFVGIDLLGIDLTALAVFSGAIGLAIGFGLQKTFGNLIAGIILLLDRSIKPGDVISVGDSFGAISKIGVRAVSIVTRDGKEHLIPNENLMTQEVVNWSYSNTNVRIHIPVGVSYGCDLALAQRLMIEAGKTPARVLASPPPVVWLKEFGDSSVNHEVLVWISDPEAGVGNVQSEVLSAIWRLFQENEIEIPFPQRDLHIKSLSECRTEGIS